MNKHTKGPWELADTKLGYPKNMLMIPISERRTAFYQCYVGTAANARLIAAAPELLEALQTIRKMSMDSELDVFLVAERAIAKAEISDG